MPLPMLDGCGLVLASLVGHGDEPVTVFFIQVGLLVLVGRLLGECMQRLGQPAVIGQLLAGIILGPSVFGGIAPSFQQTLFPVHGADRQMLNAVSELGVLMLLLLTGMETDLTLVKRVRRAATAISIGGIVFPFVCGYALGELLPEDMLPDPSRRLLTSLFIAVALSISSVKIVAAVLREVDFLRRNLGQVILASAITDDIIGWTLLACIGGMAAHGKIVLGPVLISLGGTLAFLTFSFTIGHRWVARIIRWANDRLVIEMPVISLILVLMLALALLTNTIGVHTVLGAFVAGIMIGESPILTKHIEEQLRGLIVALFMPVFFGVAGLSIDLKVLGDLRMLEMAVLFVAIASLGKLGGAYCGSRLVHLGNAEAIAIGVGMNARGSTEIILATIGLSMGVLNQSLFTIIVVMAVVTTLLMPPLLRWALGRVPTSKDEKTRLDTEAAEEKDLMPKVERILVAVDASNNARLAGHFAGCLIGARQIAATILDLGRNVADGEKPSEAAAGVLKAAEMATHATEAETGTGNETGSPAESPKPAQRSVRELVSIRPSDQKRGTADEDIVTAILAESKNGYGLLIIGLDESPNERAFQLAIGKIIHEFTGPVGILVHAGEESKERCEKILVPTTGADYSRFGAEIAVSIAKGCGAEITALHVSTPPLETDLLRRPQKLLRPARTLLDDIVALGRREGVRVTSRALVGVAKESLILRQAHRGGHQLIVLGTKAWSGQELHFGRSAETIIERAPGPILVVKS